MEGKDINLFESIWISRDFDGTLVVWSCKPYRKSMSFTTDNEVKDWLAYLDDNLYPEVTWENSPKMLVVNLS